MTISELKNTLIKEINNTNDPDTLGLLHIILENKNAKLPELNEWQLKRIEDSERQISNGQFYTEEEANKIIEKWFEGK
jgi:hypothetical protein